MKNERIFFMNFEEAPVHDGDHWVGIAIGLEDLKEKYKETLEELRKVAEHDYTSYYGLREDQLIVYEYIDKRFKPYPTEGLKG